MDISLKFEQLPFKSEHLLTNSKYTHVHDNDESYFISWNDCDTLIYPLNIETNMSIFELSEFVVLSLCCSIAAVVTYKTKAYCIDQNGTVFSLKKIHSDSPDLFDYSVNFQASQDLSPISFKWVNIFAQSCDCKVLSSSSYSDGIALIMEFDGWIVLQLLKINIDNENVSTICNATIKQILPLIKANLYEINYFGSFIWKDYFSRENLQAFLKSNKLSFKDIFFLALNNYKVYLFTSDTKDKKILDFFNFPQKIIHIQFIGSESKKLLCVSENGILILINCNRDLTPSYIYLSIDRVECLLFVYNNILLSDGFNLLLLTLNEEFSGFTRKVITSLKGVLSLNKLKNCVIATTRLNQIYKLSPINQKITENKEQKYDLKLDDILTDIKKVCENCEILESQNNKINLYINAISLVARKKLIVKEISVNLLIYSGHKAVKLGGCENDYVFMIKISTISKWLFISSAVWKMFVRVTDNKNYSSYNRIYKIETNFFNCNQALVFKHFLPREVAENCVNGTVICEFVCELPKILGFDCHCLFIKLNPIQLNALYFVKVERPCRIPFINPILDHFKYTFKYPQQISLPDCLKIIMNKNRHRMTKSFYNNITGK
ncbi:uncharacterized protein LOC126896420 isoform X2 [Daktulosphaira vitifoliae]|uniref:uncharacterized protein LOC126896420 isoform X2 n=1 Tax=Daktulosphaira vitifoliae TaxID=58002 RepID=UPI0021AAC406|nr:uncharacterized protein LOC126896420 isoform X2 [Daktulosphaira vitifoliae]XP_050525144.1 uncharacterized protein LOC126896420 isoform X2 [Daktulosphaira vitifoliae]